MDETNFELRKKEHIQQSLREESQSLIPNEWDKIFFIPEALPEIDFAEVSLKISSLGQEYPNPYFISSMTAGHPEAPQINSVLAEACSERQWLLGVGSQRKELTSSEASREWKELRKKYPRVLLASNIGLSQIIQTPSREIQKLIESAESKVLFVHTNPLQEALQLEGTPQFKGGYVALEKLVKAISVPVIVKEVGSGISISTIQRLKEVGVAGVDISGRGGTHWGRVEGLRAPALSLQAKAAQTFCDWGLSTPEALYQWHCQQEQQKHSRLSQALSYQAAQADRSTPVSQLNQASPGCGFEIWASGGIRNGLQAAKCVALGAQRVGLAKPFLEAALKGVEAVYESMDLLEYELKLSLFCTGIKNIADLQDSAMGRKVWVWQKD